MIFSENKKFAALAERSKDAKDVIGVYYAGNDWVMMNQIQVDTYDLQDIKFISGDSSIVVWDTALESKILVYSVGTGDLLSKFEPEVVGLGVKSLSISPAQNLISTGLYDGQAVLYNILTAQEICSLQHVNKIDLNQKSSKTMYIYQEEMSKDRRANI